MRAPAAGAMQRACHAIDHFIKPCVPIGLNSLARFVKSIPVAATGFDGFALAIAGRQSETRHLRKSFRAQAQDLLEGEIWNPLSLVSNPICNPGSYTPRLEALMGQSTIWPNSMPSSPRAISSCARPKRTRLSSTSGGPLRRMILPRTVFPRRLGTAMGAFCRPLKQTRNASAARRCEYAWPSFGSNFVPRRVGVIGNTQGFSAAAGGVIFRPGRFCFTAPVGSTGAVLFPGNREVWMAGIIARYRGRKSRSEPHRWWRWPRERPLCRLRVAASPGWLLPCHRSARRSY